MAIVVSYLPIFAFPMAKALCRILVNLAKNVLFSYENRVANPHLKRDAPVNLGVIRQPPYINADEWL